MKQWTRKQIMKGLKKKVPNIDFIKKSENIGRKGGIWTYQRGWTWFYKGVPVFDHEIEEYGHVLMSEVGEKDPILKKMEIKTAYVDGVFREIHNWLEDRGWYPQWYNVDTLFLWPYNIEGFEE